MSSDQASFDVLYPAGSARLPLNASLQLSAGGFAVMIAQGCYLKSFRTMLKAKKSIQSGKSELKPSISRSGIAQT